MEAESFKDAVLWVLTLEKGDSNYTQSSEAGKGKETDAPPEYSKGTQSSQHL